MLVLIREAVDHSVYYTEIATHKKRYVKRLFEEEEIERAETIVTALNGLQIDSAQELLEKINIYLLQDSITV